MLGVTVSRDSAPRNTLGVDHAKIETDENVENTSPDANQKMF